MPDPAPLVRPVAGVTPVVTLVVHALLLLPHHHDGTELSAALVECGWDEAHVQETLTSLDEHQDCTGDSAGASEGQKSEGRVKVTLDSFLACLLAASRYKSVFST